MMGVVHSPGGDLTQRILRTMQDYLASIPSVVTLMAFGRLLNSAARRMAIPFLALYLSEVLHAPTGQIGIVLALSPLCGVFGQSLGGGLTDRFGRRPVLLGSLAFESLLLFLMALAHSLAAFALLNALLGLLSAAYWPTSQAVVADATRPEARVRSYSFLYFMNNIGAAVGPAVGAGLALTGHGLVFSLSAAIVLSWAVVLFRRLPDTAPPAHERRAFGEGYVLAMRDRRLLLYALAAFLSAFAYNLMDTSLPLFLVELHVAAPSTVYGIFMTLNGIMVVAGALFIARLTERRSPTRVLALGAGLYALTLICLSLARGSVALISIDVPFTTGEMLGATVSGAYLASLAPAADRGVYMGVSSLSWGLASALAPLSAGYLLGVLPAPFVPLLLSLVPIGAAVLYARQGRVSRSEEVSVPA
jgi:MFS family permease